MKCFIAMAFGYQDTDELYDHAICEILRSQNIDPVRVDRIEHNDAIDDRIVNEIKSADFAIADLTYARPSVYYEAGIRRASDSGHLHDSARPPKASRRRSIRHISSAL